MKFDGETRNFAVENDRENLGLESPFRFFSKWDPPISIFIEVGPPISIFIEMGSPRHFDFFSKWDAPFRFLSKSRFRIIFSIFSRHSMFEQAPGAGD